MCLFFPLRRNRSEHDSAIEDPLEKVGLAPRRVELRLAIRAGGHFQIDATRADAAGHLADELAVASVEPVRNAEDPRKLLHDRTQVGVESLPVLVTRLGAASLVISRE